MEERRRVKRLYISLKGLFFYGGLEHEVVSKDVAPGGAFFYSKIIPPEGENLSMELTITEKEKEHKVYMLGRVIRTKDHSELEEEGGFAVRWIEASSYESIEPLKIFIKAILGIATGFIMAFKPEEARGRKKFSFKFPEFASLRRSTTEIELQGEQETSPTFELRTTDVLKSQKEAPRKSTTGLYIIIPVIYGFDGKEYEGAAIKLTERGLKIDTDDVLPDLYKRIVIKLLLHGKDKKKNFLQLNGSVILVKYKDIHEKKGGQIDVELTLFNNPQVLSVYRNIVNKLREATGTK